MQRYELKDIVSYAGINSSQFTKGLLTYYVAVLLPGVVKNNSDSGNKQNTVVLYLEKQEKRAEGHFKCAA